MSSIFDSNGNVSSVVSFRNVKMVYLDEEVDPSPDAISDLLMDPFEDQITDLYDPDVYSGDNIGKELYHYLMYGELKEDKGKIFKKGGNPSISKDCSIFSYLDKRATLSGQEENSPYNAKIRRSFKIARDKYIKLNNIREGNDLINPSFTISKRNLVTRGDYIVMNNLSASDAYMDTTKMVGNTGGLSEKDLKVVAPSKSCELMVGTFKPFNKTRKEHIMKNLNLIVSSSTIEVLK